MTVWQDIYFITACLGFAYIVGGAFLGALHGQADSSGHGHSAGQHGAHTHSDAGGAHICHDGVHGHTHIIGHSASHSGGHQTHSAGTHSAKASQASSESTSQQAGSNHGQHSHQHLHDQSTEQKQALSITQAGTRVQQVPSLYLRILDILSPTKLAFFAFFFGASGFVCVKFLPGYLSMIPAFLVAFVFANLFFNLMSNFLSRLYSSTNFKKEALIGSQGQLTVSIEAGSVGEVLVRTGNSRYTSRAKAEKPEQTINKLAKVIVIDIKDDIFIVEPFDDASLLEDKT